MNLIGNSTDKEIAVIGMACRFPDAQNINEFWNNLCNGKESVRFFTDSEMIANGINKKNLYQPNFIKAGAYVEDIDKFDADFFNYSSQEAEMLDPQLRLFLECAWESLENAAISCNHINCKAGIYVGVPSIDFYLLEHLGFNSQNTNFNSFLQKIYNCGTRIATRVAYHLNFSGPAIAIQTACSSSLYAIHLACQALNVGDCAIALAAGVNIDPRQKSGYFYNQNSIFSADGHCNAFDARATGAIFGNGLGVVVLKRLSDAIRDGDRVDAIIRGSAINNDGCDKLSFVAPSIKGQSQVVIEALKNSCVNPETLTYVEAHGAGTVLGDAIEIAALSKAYRMFTKATQYCAIGSVKTNIGHLIAAAGIAGFIKVVLSLKNKCIPPSVNFNTPNPNINFAQSPFYVNVRSCKWKSISSYPRRAGINSIGIGGTNAHIILEEALNKNKKQYKVKQKWSLLCLSAKNYDSLNQAIEKTHLYLKNNTKSQLLNVVYTLQIGRTHFNHRAFVLCDNYISAIEQIENGLLSCFVINKKERKKNVFVFFEESLLFHNRNNSILDFCKKCPFLNRYVDYYYKIIKTDFGLNLNLGECDKRNAYSKQILQRNFLRVFIFGLSLSQFLINLGISPDIVIGYNLLGEYTAACVAGILKFKDVCKLLIRLSDVLTSVLGGIDTSENDINKREILSTLLTRISNRYIPYFKKISISASRIDCFPLITRFWTEGFSIDYWQKQLCSVTNISDSFNQFLNKYSNVNVLEIGTMEYLKEVILKYSKTSELWEGKRQFFSLTKIIRDEHFDERFFWDTLGNLWLISPDMDFRELYVDNKLYKLELPTYCFQKNSYWRPPLNSVR